MTKMKWPTKKTLLRYRRDRRWIPLYNCTKKSHLKRLAVDKRTLKVT